MSRRAPVHYNLPADVTDLVKARAQAEGDNSSRLVERALRHFLAMPAAASANEHRGEDRPLALTRSDRAILDVLKLARPDPLTFEAVVEQSGLTNRRLRGDTT